jgi:RimJ/RimL family protein N-acetyltransferase
MVLILPHSLKTDRLMLRPTYVGDADRAFEIQTDWEVARMLSLASFPPDRREIERWFADHQLQWEAGYAYRFAVVLEGRMVGLVDIDGIGEGEGTLGYWFDHAVWGHGYAFEAAQAVTRFALEGVGLFKLKAAHAHDNLASGHILTKLGFSRLDIVELFSRPRNKYISQCRYVKLSGSTLHMQVRPAKIADADRAIGVIRRSIQELCEFDHKSDSATLSMWLSNKTADNMRRWIAAHTVLVTVEGDRMTGVAAVRANGEVFLNYVAPEARFRGVSKCLMQGIEVWASSRGLKWLTLESSATALPFYLSTGWTMTGPPQPGFGVTTRNPMRKPVTVPPAA